MDPDSDDFDPVTLRYKQKKASPEPALITRKMTGTQLTRIEDARRKQAELLKNGDPGLQWGTLRIPSWPLPNFAVFGLIGAGKTTVLRLLAQDLLPNVGNRRAKRLARCLLYDPKRDLLPHVISLHQDPSLVVLTNPLDARCSAWNLAQDFQSLTYAEELAQLIVPLSDNAEESDRAFYPKTVRLILQGVFQAFIKTRPGRWTLRDVVLATDSPDDLEQLFRKAAPHTQMAMKRLEQVKETYGNMMMSVYEKLHPYRILASLWHRATSSFSLQDWMEHPKTLLLGLANDQRATVRRMNRLLFNRAGQLLLSQPEKPKTVTYLILDELARAGKLAELSYVMAEGRSRYISAILASQGIELLKEVYGEQALDDLLSHCRNRGYLCVSKNTAQWAAEEIGKAEVVEESRSVGTSHKPGEPSNNRSLHRHERYAVRPEEFRHHPDASLELGHPLWGTYQSTAYGIVAHDEIPADLLFGKMLRKVKTHAAFIARPQEHQELAPWTDAERASLGLGPAKPGSRRDPFDAFIGRGFGRTREESKE